jgi:hypothetical protein
MARAYHIMNKLNTILLTYIVIRVILLWCCVDVSCKLKNRVSKVHVVDDVVFWLREMQFKT